MPLVVLYYIQITQGCSDTHCTQPFCRSNIHKTFHGRDVTASGAFALAMQLASLRGDQLLCDKLDPDQDLSLKDYQATPEFKTLYQAIQAQPAVTEWADVATNPSQFMDQLTMVVGKSPPDGLLKVLYDAVVNKRIPFAAINPSYRKFLARASPVDLAALLVRVLQVHSADSSSPRQELIQDVIAHLCGDDAPSRARAGIPSDYAYLTRWPSTAMSTCVLGPFVHRAKRRGDDPASAQELSDRYMSILCSFQTGHHFRETRPLTGHEADEHVYLTGQPALHPESRGLHMFRVGCLRMMESVINASLALIQINAKVSYIYGRVRHDFAPEIVHGSLFSMNIDRSRFLQDAFGHLTHALYSETAIRLPLSISFVGEEITVDQGGVQIEFFELLGSYMVSGGYFDEDSESRLMWFRPDSHALPVSEFELLGAYLALGLYNGCNVGVNFPSILYRYLRATDQEFSARQCSLADMKELSPARYRSYCWMLDQSAETLEGLDIDYGDGTVTRDNVYSFVSDQERLDLFYSCERQLRAFRRGFLYVLRPELLDFLSPHNLQLAVEGEHRFNVDELRHSTTYLDGLNAHTQVVEWFWELVESFEPRELRLLLEFVTGSSRVPAGGPHRLDFTIQGNGANDLSLPSASVCTCRLLLPLYSSKQILEDKLLYALNNTKGFGLV